MMTLCVVDANETRPYHILKHNTTLNIFNTVKIKAWK